MPRGFSISIYKWLPNYGSIPSSLCRVVLQLQPTNGCPTAARYHRLYAAWFFNFNLQMVPNCGSIPPALCRVVLQFQPTNGAQLRLDTTGFMPRGSSISTYKW